MITAVQSLHGGCQQLALPVPQIAAPLEQLCSAVGVDGHEPVIHPGGDARRLQQRGCRGDVADELAVRERVSDEVAGGRLVGQSRAPSSETRTATASYNTDGPPSSFWSATISVPSLVVTPPTLRATNSTMGVLLLDAAARRRRGPRRRRRR